MRKRIGVIAWLLLSAFFAPVFAEENSNFSQVFDSQTFNAGKLNLNINKSVGINEKWQGIMTYPAENQSGQAVDFNISGAPFPVLVYWVDDGEELDNYEWITELANSGYVVIVAPTWDNMEEEELLADMAILISQLAEYNTNGSTSVNNLIGALDLEHWGVAGHGTGAMSAALVNALWQSQNSTVNLPPPRALFALGIDISDSRVQNLAGGTPAEPSMALFLTGTADDLAPAADNLDKVIENWNGGWHRMSPHGANHLQYEDENDWWEFGDGSGDMDKEEQQTHAMDHIQPYLDLILKGDHTKWENASNRDIDPQTISDSDAYVDENLNNSRLLKITGTTSPDEELQLGQSANLSINLSHRDGSILGASSSSAWCRHWNGSLIAGGFDDGNDSAHCTIEGDMLVPGGQVITLFAEWHGMMASYDFTLTRGNTPLQEVLPTPQVSFDQHTSITLQPSLFATDPDGQDIIFMQANLSGNGSENISIYNNGSEITLTHVGEPEWQGSLALDIWLSEVSSNPDSLNLSTVVTLLPVDDAVIQLADIPQQSFEEDSDGLQLNLSQWFEDPEGQDLVVVGSSNDANISLDWQDNLLHIDAAENWSGAAILNISVSDGATAAIWEAFPLRVNSLPDPPVFILTNFSFEEDSSIQIPLSSIAYDSDSGNLQYSLSDEECSEPPLTVAISGDFLVLSSRANWFGIEDCWQISVNDGSTNITSSFTVNVSSVDDAPSVAWHSPEVREDGNISLGFTFFDDDQPITHQVRIAWREGDWVDINGAACLEWSDGALACTLLLEPLFFSLGEHSIWAEIESQGASTGVQKLSYSISEGEEQANAAEVEEVVSMFDDIKLRIAAGAIFVLLIVAFLGNMRKSTTTTVVEQTIIGHQQPKAVIEIVEDVIEVFEDEKPATGLLDLANRRK
ncbi:MAG TPA: hypothetical protein EYQ85_04905 [Candidatus Poseidoniales archaeon]|nr:hypothetical protein [Candidatus Poseidoniales archaeon]